MFRMERSTALGFTMYLVLGWVEQTGGLTAMAEKNLAKARQITAEHVQSALEEVQ